MHDISQDNCSAFSLVAASHLLADGEHLCVQTLVEEVPCALRYNGFSHAVMMVTPSDLEDFVYGFSLTEGLIDAAADIRCVTITPEEDGLVASVELTPPLLHRFLAERRVRRLEGRTGCGLCGVEDLTDIRKPAGCVSRSTGPDLGAIERAVQSIRDFQPLSRGTRAAHAAAWVDLSGEIVATREDVGRHNALDKLIGAKLTGAFDAHSGFCLITSRCSYEMAQKAIAAGITTLVSVSAPTAYAVRTAQAAGLRLYALAKGGGQLLYSVASASEDPSHVRVA